MFEEIEQKSKIALTRQPVAAIIKLKGITMNIKNILKFALPIAMAFAVAAPSQSQRLRRPPSHRPNCLRRTITR
ncbi:hypothetical protein HHL21_17905 [Massilia sp. RP-1-19]|uniref:Uncharacterized protein n=1 Tax=Massilia polaris TaxID=2728846 RepID=A0A848HS49_9BURK|nr:hypothetical protein [Massilia polaris]NML62919.1 hypothetical protein [Massilia polaris]